MSRPDQSITFLRSHGYSVFRFPRASAQPLELMHRDGKDLTRLGMVSDLVAAGDLALPQASRDASPGIDIEGKETSKVNVAIGLSILGSFIGALGGASFGTVCGRGVTMAQIAQGFSGVYQRPVVDKTGLEGQYDFDLAFTPDVKGGPGVAFGAACQAPAGDRPALSTAMQEQLGIRVEAGRAPVEVLVIDGAEKPTAN